MASTILYKRVTFVTHLPVGHLYTPSHYWLARQEDRRWRVGLTKFALRMLGEIVDVQFDSSAEADVVPGTILGSIEGFKAVSDVFCVGHGRFLGMNPALQSDLEAIAREPYEAGWLYGFEGEPDARSMDVQAYQDLLNTTIDHMVASQQTDDTVS